MWRCRSPFNLMFVILALVLNAVNFKPAESCSIYCENGKIPCGGYGATCEGFRGCVFPGECSNSGSSGGGQSNSVTVSTNYDVIRPYGPSKPSYNRPFQSSTRPFQSYSRPFQSFARRTFNRFYGK